MKNLKIFAKTLEEEAREQIENLANSEAYGSCKIRIMPDSHAGKGCTIGTTMVIQDKITPSLCGVDIGCGILAIRMGTKLPNLEKLDKIIHEKVPHGRNIHEHDSSNMEIWEAFMMQGWSFIIEKGMYCYNEVDKERVINSIGTLGGGNHFIEVAKSEKTGDYYLLIHSGSRSLGVTVCNYYQKLAERNLARDESNSIREDLINRLKSEGRERDIQSELQKLPKSKPIDKTLAYLEGEDMSNYLLDMKVTKEYAKTNRWSIAYTILNNLQKEGEEIEFDPENPEIIDSIHNYIDVDNKILRKGATSAQKEEKLIIPINMKDGSLLCVGKGNEDWNFSAPHGAGRLMSRNKAKSELSLEEFKKTMEGVFSTTVDETTLDEAPMAYKPMEEIKEAIKDTVDIIDVLKPVYNFKSSE